MHVVNELEMLENAAKVKLAKKDEQSESDSSKALGLGEVEEQASIPGRLG